jgi:hypothetical protein
LDLKFLIHVYYSDLRTTILLFYLSSQKRVLGLEEMKSIPPKPLDRNVAVAISDAIFAWHFAPPSKEKKQKRKRYTLFLKNMVLIVN